MAARNQLKPWAFDPVHSTAGRSHVLFARYIPANPSLPATSTVVHSWPNKSDTQHGQSGLSQRSIRETYVHSDEGQPPGFAHVE